MQWRRIFQVLRLMEFSGRFMPGIFEQIKVYSLFPGGTTVFTERIERGQYLLDECGRSGLTLRAQAARIGRRPSPRLPTNFIVFHGARLKVVSRRNGRELLIKTGHDDPALPAYFSFAPPS